MQVRCGELGEPRPSIHALQVKALGKMVKQERLQWVGVVEEILQIRSAFGPHYRVGVLALGQKQKLGLAAILHGRQGGLESPKRRFAPRLIAVKAKHHLGHDAK